MDEDMYSHLSVVCKNKAYRGDTLCFFKRGKPVFIMIAYMA